ncbi:MAG: hypothetical protein IT380_30590 [Myxococcales bacterium]|nr:hypothetical protein [Myxococcales bacterium]
MSVDEWRRRFDLEYEHPRRIEEDCTSRSLSGGTVDQDYYFLAYCIDGLVSAWRATGDDTYLDEALRLIGNTVDSSVPDALGRRHWAGTYALWDSYYWRMVTSLLRVMQAHPELLARADYQARYDDLLAFSVGLWGYWRDDGLGNFYRSRTHMASHWARIGMDLYLITGDAEYREVFDNISHGVQVGQPSNLRTQFQPNLAHPTAYVWASVWGAELDASVQDTSHAGALVAFIHEAALAGMYWTQADIDALANTLMLVVWDPALDGGYHQYVDGTDPAEGPYGLPNTTGGRLHEWLNLGRHRADIQARIETEYLDQTRRNTSFYAYQLYGIGALNARVLADGRPYY